MIKTLSILIFGALPFCQAHAIDGTFRPSSSSIQLPSTIDTSNALFNGTVLWTSPPVTSELLENQTSMYSGIYATVQPGYPITNSDIYETNLSGIGIRWKATWRGPNYAKGITLSITSDGAIVPPAAGYSYAPYQQTVWIELVKTGAIQSGSLSITNVAKAVYNCPCTKNWTITVTGTSKIERPTCKVQVPNIPVSLGRVSMASVNEIARISSPVSFNIGLSCTGGGPGAVTDIYASLTDASQPSNISNILSLSSTSTAKGFGIQILRNGSPLKYGPDSVNGANQWKAGNITGGVATFSIPLTAHYIRTEATANPGTANGQATFTLIYK